MSDSDVELLQRYAKTRAEDAFAELVRRRLKLVSVALRQCGGDVALASEVTQRVFTDLARKAEALSQRTVLSGWLYRSARFAASDAVRAERRRRAHEQEVTIMKQIMEDSAHDAEWRELRPVLDEVLSELGDRDRDAVLLRFFENRGFRDVGAALRISEDAARMRVDRALEKLRQMLARRGVTSTAALLGLALANQAGATPPAGLAASVTTSAVGAITSSATIFGFMSSAKITMGTLGAAALLLVSVTTNVWLGTLPSQAMTAPTSPAPDIARTTLEPSLPVAAFISDPTLMRDRLRAAGASPALTRAMVEGLLRRQYRERLSEIRAERARNGWWRESWAGNLDRPPPMQDDRALLQEMVSDRLEKLFGPDPGELAIYNARFDFLPEAKRRIAIALAQESDRVAARYTGGENGTVDVAASREREEKQAAFVATLTLEERTEYGLRRVTEWMDTRMSLIDASETEFRSIAGIIIAPENSDTPRDPAARSARDDRMMQEMVKAIGFERALDYVWSATPEFELYSRLARNERLPASTAGHVLQLAAETAEQAIAISRDASLNSDRKRAATRALQESVRPQLDALLPPPAQARLSLQAMQWFTALSDGRYRPITTTLNNNEGFSRIVGTVSLDDASLANSPTPPLPRRPSK